LLGLLDPKKRIFFLGGEGDSNGKISTMWPIVVIGFDVNWLK